MRAEDVERKFYAGMSYAGLPAVRLRTRRAGRRGVDDSCPYQAPKPLSQQLWRHDVCRVPEAFSSLGRHRAFNGNCKVSCGYLRDREQSADAFTPFQSTSDLQQHPPFEALNLFPLFLPPARRFAWLMRENPGQRSSRLHELRRHLQLERPFHRRPLRNPGTQAVRHPRHSAATSEPQRGKHREPGSI